jgi:hypothetical protein
MMVGLTPTLYTAVTTVWKISIYSMITVFAIFTGFGNLLESQPDKEEILMFYMGYLQTLFAKPTATLDEAVSDSHVFQLGALKSRQCKAESVGTTENVSDLLALHGQRVGRILNHEAEIGANLAPEQGGIPPFYSVL